MATILESYEIESPEYGRSFKIDLVEGIDDTHIEFIEQQWQPILQRQRDLALLNFFQLPVASQTLDKFHEMLGKFGTQDSHWEWRTKCSLALGTNRRTYALLNRGEVEAAMCLLFGKLSRDSTPLPIVYVDYVAVAPWNRLEIQNPRRFQGFGRVMLGAAVEVSNSMGFEGRCGLHSLSHAEGFYRGIGMSDLGIDSDYSSLRYFELSEAAARKFKEKGDV